MTEKLSRQITDIEKSIRLNGWSPSKFLELTLYRAEISGDSIRTYSEAVREIIGNENLFGGSPEFRATRLELQHSIGLLRSGGEDYIAMEISGVKSSLLTEEKALQLKLPNRSDYQAIIDDLKKKESLFGSYIGRKNARITLEVALRQF